jgi:hypothetical protein
MFYLNDLYFLNFQRLFIYSAANEDMRCTNDDSLLHLPPAEVCNTIEKYLIPLNTDLDQKNIRQNFHNFNVNTGFIILQILYGVFCEISYTHLLFKVFCKNSLHNIHEEKYDSIVGMFNEISNLLTEKEKAIIRIHDIVTLKIEHIENFNSFYNALLFVVSKYGSKKNDKPYIGGLYLYLFQFIQILSDQKDLSSLLKLRQIIIEYCVIAKKFDKENQQKCTAPITDNKIGPMLIMINTAISMLILNKNEQNNIITPEQQKVANEIYNQLIKNLNCSKRTYNEIELNPPKIQKDNADFSCIELNETIKSFRERYPKEDDKQMIAYQINKLIYQKCKEILDQRTNQALLEKEIKEIDKNNTFYNIITIKKLYLHYLEKYLNGFLLSKYQNQQSEPLIEAKLEDDPKQDNSLTFGINQIQLDISDSDDLSEQEAQDLRGQTTGIKKYMKPINGLYLLLAAVVIICVTCLARCFINK